MGEVWGGASSRVISRITSVYQDYSSTHLYFASKISDFPRGYLISIRKKSLGSFISKGKQLIHVVAIINKCWSANGVRDCDIAAVVLQYLMKWVLGREGAF